MSIASRYCPSCRKQGPAVFSPPNHALHFILTLLTCGWWLLIWLPIALFSGGYNCQSCGKAAYGSSGGYMFQLIARVCMALILLFAIWVVYAAMHRAELPIAQNAPPIAVQQHVAPPANGGNAQAKVVQPVVGQRGADRLPANVQPAAKAGKPVVKPVREDKPELVEEADAAQRERDAAKKAEHDATAKLKAAKSLMSANKKAAIAHLKEIVEKYPDTEAAKEADKLLK